MGKEEFEEHLKSKGFNVINERGCIMVLVPEITKKIQKDIRQCVKDCGYDKSYGLREVRDGE